jgi:hypothetical protein
MPSKNRNKKNLIQPINILEFDDNINIIDNILESPIKSKNKKDVSSNTLTLIDHLIERSTKQVKELREIKNDLIKLRTMHIRELNHERKKNGSNKQNKVGGVRKPEKVPTNIAKLIGVEDDIYMERCKVLSKIYEVLYERGLHCKNKKVLRADEQVMKALNISDNVNKVTDPNDLSGLTFRTLPKILAKCYKS